MKLLKGEPAPSVTRFLKSTDALIEVLERSEQTTTAVRSIASGHQESREDPLPNLVVSLPPASRVESESEVNWRVLSGINKHNALQAQVELTQHRVEELLKERDKAMFGLAQSTSIALNRGHQLTPAQAKVLAKSHNASPPSSRGMEPSGQHRKYVS